MYVCVSDIRDVSCIISLVNVTQVNVMWKILLISFVVVVVVIVVGDTSSSRSSKKSNSLVQKYVTLYQTENLDRVKSITRTARRDATDNPTFETQAILALSLQREERMRKIGKGYSGLASKRIRMALKAFEKAHELVESASSDLDRGLLYVAFAKKSIIYLTYLTRKSLKHNSRPLYSNTGTQATPYFLESLVIRLERKMRFYITIFRQGMHLSGTKCGLNAV